MVCKPEYETAGLNLRAAIQIAERLGCCIQPVRRTGEIRFSHRLLLSTVRVNRRRKDAPRSLSGWLKDVVSASAAAEFYPTHW